MAVFLTLGPITFANTEVPENLSWGSGQKLAVHELVGGQRVIDSMGRSYNPIRWSGLFFGSTATFRARYLDGLSQTGNPLNLTWTQFNYLVKIREFNPSFERFYQIPYSIELEVIQDLNNPFPILLPVAYNDAILNLMIEANDLANAIADPSISNSIAILSDTVNNVASFSNASDAELAPVVAAIAASEAVVTASASALSQTIFG